MGLIADVSPLPLDRTPSARPPSTPSAPLSTLPFSAQCTKGSHSFDPHLLAGSRRVPAARLLPLGQVPPPVVAAAPPSVWQGAAGGVVRFARDDGQVSCGP
eukprot:5449886-Prymnesium_polylepis.1